MTIDLFIEKLDLLGKDLPNYLERIARRESNTMTTSIITRLTEIGVDAGNNKFGGTAIRLDSSGVYSESHGRKRRKGGFQVSHMDFTFSNNMLKSVDEISSNKNKNMVQVVTGAIGESNRDKMNWNVDREGRELLYPNSKEIETLVKNFSAQLEAEVKGRLG